jgi:asparagine synthetase B (glutamine-hydrolysing)
MTDFEIVAGWIFGSVPVDWPTAVSRHPRQVLEDELRPLLTRSPSYVLFSGGRDSSAVLACAVELARREGLPIPIPVTRVYPGRAASDEAQWQRRVLSHLKLDGWIRIEVTDELDILGPTAREGLLRHGVVFPATAFPQAFVFRQLASSPVFTGEGGDEVFGAQRITPLTALIRRRRPFSAELAAATLDALSWPARRYKRSLRSHAEDSSAAGRDWLRPHVRRRVAELRAAHAAESPLYWDAGVRALLRQRWLRIGLANLHAVAADSSVDLAHPLLAPKFVNAVAAWGGRWGPVGRTETMLRLFADVLPEDVLRRTSKARFNSAAIGDHSLSFAREWDGQGIDADSVDPEALRRRWLSDLPPPATMPLLQQAWLAGRPASG